MRVRALILLLAAVITAVSAWAEPYAQGGNVYVYQVSPPSWYVAAASYGTLYTYAYPSSPTVTVRRFTQLYSFATSNVWLRLASGQVYSGASYDGDNYEYRLTLTQSYSSGGTFTYTWSGNLFSFTASGSGTVSFYVRVGASSHTIYNVTVVLYRDGAQVGRLTWSGSQSPGYTSQWSQLSFSVSGSHTISAYVYVRHYALPPDQGTLTVTVEVDRIAVSGAYIVNTADLSATASPTGGAQQSGLQVRAVYTATLSSDVDAAQVVSVSPAPASYTYSYSKPTLSVTAFYNAQTQSLSSGTVALPKPGGYTVLQYIARAPQGLIVITNGTDYLDEAYAPGSARALQVALVQPSWRAVYTLAQRYALSVLNSSTATVGSVPAIPAGKYIIIASKADPADKCYLKLNSTLLFSAASLNNTVLNVPGSYSYIIAFSLSGGAPQGGAAPPGLRPSGAGGWLGGYLYRKEVFVLGSSAGTVTNYPVAVMVYYGSGVDSPSAVYLNGRCRPDFSDVVFTANDGKTVLKSWVMASVPGQYALFWVELPTVPPYPSVASFYVYYGSGAAVAARVVPGTYFYDDFNSYADGTAVPVQGAGMAVVTTVNGSKILRITQTNSSGALTLVAQTARYGKVLLRVYVPPLSGGQGFYAGWSDGTLFSLGRPLRGVLAMLGQGVVWVVVDNRPMIGLVYDVRPGWYALEVKWYNQFFEVTVIPESSPSRAVTFTYSDPGLVNLLYNHLTIGVNSSMTSYVDYVVHARYVMPEPAVVGVGAEEVVATALVPQPPQPRPVVIAPSNPALQPASALSDPVSRMALVGAFVAAMVIAAAKLEVRLSVALVLAGAVVLLTGLLLGDSMLVAVGGVLIALGVALATI
jgi:hypothetical protein